MGCSVNDLCCVPLDFISNIFNFEVLSLNFSDHLPIVLSLTLSITANHDTLPLLPQLIWRERDAEIFKKTLETNVNSISSFPSCNNEFLTVLVDLIKCSFPHIPGCSDFIRSVRKMSWFDGNCFRARKKSFALLNFFKFIS